MSKTSIKSDSMAIFINHVLHSSRVLYYHVILLFCHLKFLLKSMVLFCSK
nr:MAG TPA: hypothetical protein [Caudoviricetes sp.]